MNETLYHILMIDDAERYHQLYESAIKDTLPAKVTFAKDGKSALDLVNEHFQNLDLIVLDLNIPLVHGEQVLQTIRQDQKFNNIPIVILTGEAAADTQSRLLEMGADDFIEKGLAPEVFGARLKAQIRHKQAIDHMTRLAVNMDLFASGVLHDIRNIETTIIALCHLIKTQLTSDPVKNRGNVIKDIDHLTEQAKRITAYANEIIQRTRETTKEPKLEMIDIAALIKEVAEFFIKENSGKMEPSLDLEIPDPLKPVRADEHFLRLAIMNICQNSIKYALPNTKPHLVVSQEQTKTSDLKTTTTHIITRFRDFGQGIKKTELRKIFEPFVKGSSQHTGAKSFGLGLSMVQKVISNMAGRVWAELPKDDLGGSVICIELSAD